jgi:GNAT superfamily N-acetyltransferase
MTDAPDILASSTLTTRSGLQLNIRPASPDDEALLAEFFTHLTPDDLRYRFLTSLGHVGHDWLKNLVEVDHTRTENFLAFDATDETLIATAMLAAEPSLDRAEVAIATRSDYKNQGVGWTMLDYVSDFARAKGIKTLESIECRDNRGAIDLEQEMGFTTSAYPDDPSLVLVTKNLAG